MSYVRTHITTTHSLPATLRGIVPATTDCQGAFLSQDRGMDAMCCARCHMVRQQMYRSKGCFITNPLAIEYFERLIKLQPDATTAVVLMMCGDKPLLHVPPPINELTPENTKDSLKQQFLLWKNLHIVSRLREECIGVTHLGFPVVFPAQDATRKEFSAHEGNEGVELTAKTLRVTNREQAFASGKWCHVICYYDLLAMLYTGQKTEERDGKETMELL